MNFAQYIAKRYFFSRKKSGAVNIITAISVLGILVGSAALIVVLSAFNGLESLVKGFYNDFDPDLKVEVNTGKFFNASADFIEEITLVDGVEAVSFVCEEKALFSFREKEYIATMKGVDHVFGSISNVPQKLQSGAYLNLERNEVTEAVPGAGVAYYLAYSRYDFGEPIQVFVPRKGSGRAGAESFVSELVYPSGIFAIQPEYDDKFMLLPLSFVQHLLDREGQVSALEIKVAGNSREVQHQIKALLPEGYSVKNRDEQQEVFFKVMQSESLFTYLVFALILGIATFTIIGSLTMLMLDKRKDLFTLVSLGSTLKDLRNIFFYEGLIISVFGGGVGILLGSLLILLQQHIGLIGVGEGYAVETYPVEFAFKDVLLVLLTVLVLGGAASWLTSRRLSYKLIGSRVV